jgi:two-component system nitrogen regulation sensor histidine kinase GlnL
MSENPSITLDLFVSQARHALAVFDADGILRHASPKFAQIFGTDPSRKTPEAVFHGEPLLAEKVATAVAENNPYYLHDAAVGSEKFNVDIAPIVGDGHARRGVAVNLFEIRRESMFSEQAKRADALGRLSLIASGLAHEIKNPLAGVKGAAQLILSETGEAPRLKEYAGIIVRESERIDRLVRELLDFTKPRGLKLARLNANKILHEIAQTARPALPGSVALKEEFDPSLPEILADEDALRQVVLNLLKNAAEAARTGGKITVRSQVVTDVLIKAGTKKRKLISLQVEDDGCGMDEERMKNIFTPYYTTKTGGTGLGLAIANRLIELHGGSIAVKSKPGAGAAFAIYLPV